MYVRRLGVCSIPHAQITHIEELVFDGDIQINFTHLHKCKKSSRNTIVLSGIEINASKVNEAYGVTDVEPMKRTVSLTASPDMTLYEGVWLNEICDVSLAASCHRRILTFFN